MTLTSKINTLLTKLQDENRYSTYLSIFRVFICIHLLKRIILIWGSLDILCSNDSFIAKNSLDFEVLGLESEFLRSNYQLFITFYVVIILLHLFGIGKYFIALLLFGFTQIFQQLISLTLNGGDNILSFLLIYLVVADSYQFFTIEKLNFKNKILREFSNFFSNLSVYCIILHLCLAYFISGIFKLHSDVWFNGVAVYYTLNLERFMGTSWNIELSKNQFFVVLSTYCVLFFELYFPVLIWFKNIKIPLLIIGLIIHIGIYIFMMIYDFQTIFIMLYGFFFTNSELKVIKNSIASKISFLSNLIRTYAKIS